MFGIEEIVLEIENFFGYDFNDLFLDIICVIMYYDIEDLIILVLLVRYWNCILFN